MFYTETRTGVVHLQQRSQLKKYIYVYAIFRYNHPNNGKGAKFGADETDIIQINTRIGGILRLPDVGRILILSSQTKAFDHAGKNCLTHIFPILFI